MAREKRTNDEGEVFEVVSMGGRADQDDLPDTEATRRTQALLEEMCGANEVGDGYVTIHRIKNGSETSCAKLPAAQYLYHDLLDFIRDNFMENERKATFRIRLYVRGASNRFQIAENKVEELEKAATSLAAPVSTGDALSDRRLAEMENRMDRFLERMERGGTAGAGAPDLARTLTAIAGFATAVAPIVVPLLKGRGGSPLDDLTKLLTITGQVRELQGGDAPAREESSELSLAALLPKGLDLLTTVMQVRAASGGQAVATPAAPALPAALPSAPVAERAEAPVAEELPDVSLMASQWPQFRQAIEQGVEYQDAAAAVFSQVPAEFRPTALTLIGHPLFFKAFFRQVPEALAYADWLMYMRDELLNLLEESAHAPSQPNGGGESAPAGDAPAVAPHPVEGDGNVNS